MGAKQLASEKFSSNKAPLRHNVLVKNIEEVKGSTMCEACSIESNQAPQDMAYTPGKPFPTHHAQNASDYLNAALSAERWIATFEHKTPEGKFWQQDPSQQIDL